MSGNGAGGQNGGGAELFSEKVRKALLQDDGGGKQFEARRAILRNQPSFESNNSSRSGSGTRTKNRYDSSTNNDGGGAIVIDAALPLSLAHGNAVMTMGGAGITSPAANWQKQHSIDMYAPPLASPQKQPFSMAKAKMLNKNQSASDLTQYINPDMLMRRRASLHQNAFDPAMKKIRQREAYKTAMCQAWLEGKACAFGDQCNFAHGEEELQPLPSNRPNPKYKTRVCENYTTTGICPFGNRCFFIHPQTAAKMDDLVEYQEQLNQTARQLEGEAIYRQGDGGGCMSGGGTPIVPRRIIAQTNKAKQFRKLESCGNFYTQYQLQQLQMQLQREHQEQMARQMEQNFYDNFPPLTAATTVDKTAAAVGGGGGGVGGGGDQAPGRKASKNTAVTGSMPLIHSNSYGNLVTNVNFQQFVPKQNHDNNNAVNKRLEERRLTLRKMQSQKSFSSSDVWYQNQAGAKSRPLLGMDAVGEQQRDGDGEQDGSDSSGPHTPPGFYQHPKAATFADSSKWSSMSSTHPTHIWPGLDTAEQQKVPSFSLFGPTEQIGSGGDLLGRMGGGVGASGGKKSPISDFEGVLMGRRSSHTPYLDEGENTQTFLDVVFGGGVGEKGSGRNKSAEYLLGKNRTNQCATSWLGLDPVNSWQMGARSTGALNDQYAQWHSQFGPPEGPPPQAGAAPHQQANNFWGSAQMMHAAGAGGGEGSASATNLVQQQFQQAYLQQQLAEYQQQQQLVAAGFMSASAAALAAAAAATSGPVNDAYGSSGQLGSSFPASSSIGNHHPSAFRPIRQLQQEHFQSPLDHNQSPYSSNSSVHASSLADELIRQSQTSLVGTNLDAMRQIWASSSPDLADKDNQQHQQGQNMPLWSELDNNNEQQAQGQQRVEIPSKLDFFSGVMKRNDALERVLKQNKPAALSRNDTLTDTEKDEEEQAHEHGKGNNQRHDREMHKLCESLNRLESAGVIGSARKSTAVDGGERMQGQQMASMEGYEPGAGAQTWAKRAMKKAFLRQKSHSSPAISRSGSITDKE